MRVLLLANLTYGTGNAITTARYARFLENSGLEVVTKDAEKVTSQETIQNLNCDAAIGIHAYRAGKWLFCSNVPYIIVIGANQEAYSICVTGTDVNVHLKDKNRNPERYDTTVTALRKAKAIVSFNEALREALYENVPNHKELPRVDKIPQSVEVDYITTSEPALRKKLHLDNGTFLVLLPAGIRSVKDPLYILEEFGHWQQTCHNIALILIGPVLDQELHETVLDKIGRTSYADGMVCGGQNNCYYHKTVDREVLLSYISESSVVLNTSREEGMSNALLEAMALGTPVVARKNGGNEAIIRHETTGWLFDSPQECIACLDAIRQQKVDSASVGENAKRKIETEHSLEVEKNQWLPLLSELVPENFP